MARAEQLIANNLVQRKQRYFSEEFKRKKVEEIERGVSEVSQISRIYQVSRVAIYKWIYKYSLMRKKAIKMVVEAESDTVKIAALRKRISELEQLLGQKQFEIEFMEKQFEIARSNYGVDLKKKASGRHSSGTGKTGNNRNTV
jgi:transposase-like protein